MKNKVPISFLIIPLVAAAIFFFQTDREHLWLDESYSVAMASHEYGEILRLVEKDVHPPLYYVALKATCAIL